jgi:hypothetical protein
MPAKQIGNAFAFLLSQAPTGASFQNLDAAGQTCPVHRRCVATGRATLVVNSASSYASGSFEHQSLDGLRRQGFLKQVAFAVLRCLQTTTASVLSSSPFELSLVNRLSSKRLFATWSGRQTGCDCLAAHNSLSLGFPLHSLHYKRKNLGGALPVGLLCLELPPEHRPVMQVALATYLPGFYSNPAPGHQLASVCPCWDTQAVSQTARG